MAELGEALEVLGCNIEARPAGAPGAGDIAAALLGAERTAADELVLSFEPSAARMVEAFVAAEQRCCAGLGWSVETSDVTRVRVVAARPQLDVLEQVFSN
jgi:hypothetical protein